MEHVFRVDAGKGGSRLDQALASRMPEISRSAIQKAIRAGGCRLDGELCLEPDRRLNGGENIVFFIVEEASPLVPEDGDLPIIWQDDYMAVCDKPPGLVTHPCPSCPKGTLVQRLLAHFPQLAEQGGERPGIIHRLDKDTSGLLLVALGESARLKLAKAFAERKIRKEYLAIVAGKPPEAGESLEPIGRHPSLKTRMAIIPENRGGKKAHTSWRRLWSAQDGSISLLAARIYTGRTHQIRAHLAHAGHPIIGDKVYAPKNIAGLAPRQMLHAWRLALEHPQTGELLRFTAFPPADFMEALAAASPSHCRVVVTGSQGCGKSTFCGLLANLGLPVISADAIVANLYRAGGPAADWLSLRFGDSAVNGDGSVDKSALFSLLREGGARREFENFVHSLVLDEVENFWARANGEDKIPVAEIPLYFECGWDKRIKPRPFVIGLRCPREIRWQRIKESRGWDMEKIKTLENWQMPEDRKMRSCDLVIDNAGGEGRMEALAADAAQTIRGRQTANGKALRQYFRELLERQPDIAGPDMRNVCAALRQTGV